MTQYPESYYAQDEDPNYVSNPNETEQVWLEPKRPAATQAWRAKQGRLGLTIPPQLPESPSPQQTRSKLVELNLKIGPNTINLIVHNERGLETITENGKSLFTRFGIDERRRHTVEDYDLEDYNLKRQCHKKSTGRTIRDPETLETSERDGFDDVDIDSDLEQGRGPPLSSYGDQNQEPAGEPPVSNLTSHKAGKDMLALRKGPPTSTSGAPITPRSTVSDDRPRHKDPNKYQTGQLSHYGVFRLCHNCGGSDHLMNNPKCPNYPSM
ncbi:hypothetical protein EYC80_002119 [Monilinia laxa]|uniref:Uncharacterized protein n=1 Tax=Monilinia laxa TaxID=61186 RepID=A0A5N6K355_MONLA|nr:hypothetical protein EYC80_002119 [Monilinia laxa]